VRSAGHGERRGNMEQGRKTRPVSGETSPAGRVNQMGAAMERGPEAV
jgi:hypothetical protein